MVLPFHSSTSIKYSSASKAKGTRLMLINEVALGNVYDVYQHQTSLTKPPQGFGSVHGVRNQDGNESEFKVCRFQTLRVRSH